MILSAPSGRFALTSAATQSCCAVHTRHDWGLRVHNTCLFPLIPSFAPWLGRAYWAELLAQAANREATHASLGQPGPDHEA